MWRSLVAVTAGLATTLGPIGSAAAEPAVSAPARWQVVASFTNVLSMVDALAAPSGRDAWVLGTAAKKIGGGPVFPAGFRWDGRHWSKVSKTSFPAAVRHTGIGCAGSSSPSNTWALARNTKLTAALPKDSPSMVVLADGITALPTPMVPVMGTTDMLGLQTCFGAKISEHQNIVTYGQLP